MFWLLCSEYNKFSIDSGIQSQLFVAHQSLKIFRKFVRWWACFPYGVSSSRKLRKIFTRSNFRIPRNSFTCHWIRIASIVLCLDLQSLPTHVSEADQSCGVFWNLAITLTCQYPTTKIQPNSAIWKQITGSTSKTGEYIHIKCYNSQWIRKYEPVSNKREELT